MRSPFLVIGLFLAVTGLGLTLAVQPAHAGITEFVGLMIAWVLHYVVAFEGWLLVKFVGILIWVAQYNGFLNATPVATGWFICRDVVNMFFILILLVIAFGTILDVDQYNYKKTLPKLLLSAVLVNFSRTFVGIFIDLSQVIMLTFVNGFSDAATGNFAKAFKIDKMLNYQDSSGSSSDSGMMMKVVAGWLLAAILIGFSVLVIVYITVLLVMRIVYIWVLIIVSPIAFFLRGVPMSSASKYYGEWWSNLMPHLIAGPLLAFFLWLTLLTVGGNGGVIQSGGFSSPTAGTGETAGTDIDAGMFSGEDLQAYIIAMALLFGGVQTAQKVAAVKLSAVTGAPGQAWKRGKSAIATGSKMMAGANKLMDKTPIGTARDRVKDSLLSGAAAMRIPGAAKSLGQHRATVAKKGADSEAWMKHLSPEQQARVAKSVLPKALMSPERLGVQREAQKAYMTNLAKGKFKDSMTPDQVKSEYQRASRELLKLGTLTNDRSAADHVKATNKTRPDLIVDDSLRTKDPVTYEKQLKELRDNGRSLGVKALNELEDGAIKPQLMMHVNPKTLSKAMETMSAAALDSLAKMGIANNDPEIIREGQEKLKMADPQHLLEVDRTSLRELQLKKYAAAKSDLAAVSAGSPEAKEAERTMKGALEGMASLASVDGFKDSLEHFVSDPRGAAAIAATMKAGGQYDAANFAGQGELLSRIAKELSAEDIAKQPADTAAILRQAAAGTGDVGKAYAAGAKSGEALGTFDYNANSGLMTAAGAAGFATAFGADKSMVQFMDAKTIGRNGGLNDVSMTMVTNLSANDLVAMGSGGNLSGAKAVIDSAAAISLADPAAATEQYRQQMMNNGVDEAVATQTAAAFAERLKGAKDSALKLLTEINDGETPTLKAPLMSRSAAGAKVWSDDVHEYMMNHSTKYSSVVSRREERVQYQAFSQQAMREQQKAMKGTAAEIQAEAKTTFDAAMAETARDLKQSAKDIKAGAKLRKHLTKKW